jgi:hypothetical protein
VKSESLNLSNGVYLGDKGDKKDAFLFFLNNNNLLELFEKKIQNIPFPFL